MKLKVFVTNSKKKYNFIVLREIRSFHIPNYIFNLEFVFKLNKKKNKFIVTVILLRIKAYDR